LWNWPGRTATPSDQDDDLAAGVAGIHGGLRGGGLGERIGGAECDLELA
jgi:hypothetical protein